MLEEFEDTTEAEERPASGIAYGGDARITLTIANDGMEASIESYTPAREGGAELTMPALMQTLLQCNVIYGVRRDALTDVIKRLQDGGDICGIILARGTPPVAASPSVLRLRGNPKYPAMPDEPIAEIAPGRPSAPGKDVNGNEVPGDSRLDSPEREPKFSCNEHCYFDQNRQMIISSCYGMVQATEKKVSLIPLHEVSEDRMSLSLTIYPCDYHNRRIDPHHIRRALLPLQLGMPSSAEITLNAIRQAQKQEAPVVAKDLVTGRAPMCGLDGQLCLNELNTIPIPGHLLKGSVADCQTLYLAEAGQLVGHLRPPQAGTPGTDIFGQEIASEPGKPVIFLPGENISADYNTNSFYAHIRGVVHIEDNTISILPLRYIQSDLGPGHAIGGNGNSCAVIHGAIVCGAQPSGITNLIVKRGIEDVGFSVSGDISLLGGICMGIDTRRRISCRNLHATHANNAHIQASGDVIINSEINGCHIEAGGVIESTRDKGQIIGGIAISGKGIIVNEAGSKMYRRTVLRVGQTLSYEEELQRHMDDLRGKVRFLTGYLDHLSLQVDDLQSGENKSAFLKQRINIRKTIDNLEEQIHKLLTRETEYHPPVVTVLKKLHPGTIIQIFGSTVEISRDTGPRTFIYDKASEKIKTV